MVSISQVARGNVSSANKGRTDDLLVIIEVLFLNAIHHVIGEPRKMFRLGQGTNVSVFFIIALFFI